MTLPQATLYSDGLLNFVDIPATVSVAYLYAIRISTNRQFILKQGLYTFNHEKIEM
jgi:hypothetical protein